MTLCFWAEHLQPPRAQGFDLWYRRLLDKRKSDRGATTLKREDRKPGRVVRGDGQRLQAQLAQTRRGEGPRGQ